LAEVQDEIIERARSLREGPNRTAVFDGADSPRERRAARRQEFEIPPAETAEIPADVPRLDARNWRLAVYIGLFFAVILFAAFFYLIQTARRLNILPADEPSQTAQAAKSPETKAGTPQSTAATPAVPPKSTVRLYTDLIPGKVSIDEKEAQDLKDGELILTDLEPGRHSIQVTGNGANAAFSYDVKPGAAPRLVGSPVVSNVMAVLVSSEEGKAQLATSAEHAAVSLDGAAARPVESDGLVIDGLGKNDHQFQVSEGKDRQRFVLTYTAAPALTVYLKSDPNAGTVVLIAKQDGADVYIDGKLYRRKTEAGQLRIPLKVGEYTIRVHKSAFIDPPPETVHVTKAEETAVNFRMEPEPQVATLELKGALAGTMVYIDKDLAAAIGPDGNATISNVKPGGHTIELRRDQALPKKFERTFKTGDVISLSGTDVTLEKVTVESTTAAPAPAAAPAATPAVATAKPAADPNGNMEVEGQQVRKGGGFVAYHVPKVAGHYSFAGQALKGGFLKHGRLQWYAGYQDSKNYILFTVDGKHASVRQVEDGHATEVGRMPFDTDSNTWVQVDVAVKPNSFQAQI